MRGIYVLGRRDEFARRSLRARRKAVSLQAIGTQSPHARSIAQNHMTSGAANGNSAATIDAPPAVTRLSTHHSRINPTTDGTRRRKPLNARDETLASEETNENKNTLIVAAAAALLFALPSLAQEPSKNRSAGGGGRRRHARAQQARDGREGLPRLRRGLQSVLDDVRRLQARSRDVPDGWHHRAPLRARSRAAAAVEAHREALRARQHELRQHRQLSRQRCPGMQGRRRVPSTIACHVSRSAR